MGNVLGQNQLTLYSYTDGTPAITAVLTNESHVIPCDKYGENGNYSGASCTMIVYEGSLDVSYLWDISVSPSPGIRGNFSGSTYTVTDISLDSVYVDFTAVRDGFPGIRKRFNVTRTKTGETGETGAAATAYQMIVSAAAIAKDHSGTLNPTTITLTAKSQTGNLPVTDYPARFSIFLNNSPEAAYTSTVNESVKTYTIPPNANTIRCAMYQTGGTSVLLDEQTIPVVYDGKDGADGTAGSDGIALTLGNENQSFSCNSYGLTINDSEILIPFSAYKGSQRIACNASYSTPLPNGITYDEDSTNATADKDGLLKFNVAAGADLGHMSVNSGTIFLFFTLDGKTLKKVFTWSKINELTNEGLKISVSGAAVINTINGYTLTTLSGNFLLSSTQNDYNVVYSGITEDDGWVYWNKRKEPIKKFSILFSDARFLRNILCYVVYRTSNSTPYVLWYGKASDQSEESEPSEWHYRTVTATTTGKWNWSYNTDIILGSLKYLTVNNSIDYTLYINPKTYFDVRLSTAVANWAYGDLTEGATINAALIEAQTITADKLATEAIRSYKYSIPSDEDEDKYEDFSSEGSYFNMETGTFRSTGLFIGRNKAGKNIAKFKGEIEASEGSIGDFNIYGGNLESEPDEKGAFLSLNSWGITSASYNETSKRLMSTNLFNGYISIMPRIKNPGDYYTQISPGEIFFGTFKNTSGDMDMSALITPSLLTIGLPAQNAQMLAHSNIGIGFMDLYKDEPYINFHYHNDALENSAKIVSETAKGLGIYASGGTRFHDGELQSVLQPPFTTSANFRAVGGDYGFIIRNDGNFTYFMLTAPKDQYGKWTDYWPIQINNRNGQMWFTANHANVAQIRSKTGYESSILYVINGAPKWAVGAGAGADTGSFGFYSTVNGYLCARIGGSGNLWLKGDLNTLSDLRFKKEISTLTENYIKIFENLNIVKYKYTYDDTKEHIGVVYQYTKKAFEDQGIYNAAAIIDPNEESDYGHIVYNELHNIHMAVTQKNIRSIKELESELIKLKKQIRSLIDN